MPNKTVLKEKQAIVAALAEKMRSAVAGVLVDYKGITVANDTKLRRELRAAGIEYEVVKNTLTRLAANEVGFNEFDEHLNGTSALAISSSDPVAAAKILSNYAKASDGKFNIKVGFVEGKVISADGVRALAELPPREVLVAQALAGLNGPISGFVNVLSANLRGLAVAINAIAEQKAGQSA